MGQEDTGYRIGVRTRGLGTYGHVTLDRGLQSHWTCDTGWGFRGGETLDIGTWNLEHGTLIIEPTEYEA